jgi:hypothetical protein
MACTAYIYMKKKVGPETSPRASTWPVQPIYVMKKVSLLLLHLSSDQIFSAPCSQTPSVYVPPIISGPKFCTHTEPQAKLYFCPGIKYTGFISSTM